MHSPDRQDNRGPWTSAVILGGLALLAAGLLALTERYARPKIIENQRAVVLRSLNEVMPVDTYDNNLLDDFTTVVDIELLGTSEPVTVYRARRNGEPAGVVMNPVAPNGYGGPIRLLVGINSDGTIAGVRVIEHRETPRLGGDDIEIEKSSWITSFNDRSLTNPQTEGWTVKKDGGVYDQFTGATITPRAIVQAVHNALLYYDANSERLFNQE